MSILRKKINPCKPCKKNSPVPRFCVSEQVKEELPIYDTKGKKVSTYIRKRFRIKQIPLSEFENEGVTADMFSIENLQRAGIEPKLVTSPLIHATLEQRSVVQDFIEDTDFEELIEPSKSSKTIGQVE